MRDDRHRGARVRRAIAVLAIAAIAATALGGCVPQDDATGHQVGGGERTTAPPLQSLTIEAPVLTASETLASRIADEIAETGRASTRSVVDAVDLTIAPMPGASTSDLEPGDGLGRSYVLDLLRSHLDELAPDQRAAADAILSPEPDPRGDEPYDGPLPPATAALTDPQEFTETTWTAFITKRTIETYADWHAKYAAFPVFASIEVTAGDPAALAADSKDAVLDAWYDPTANTCRIRYYIDRFRSVPYAEQKTLLAHELFHCYQGTLNLVLGSMYDFPSWALEGGAQYAAIYLYEGVPGAIGTDILFDAWFTNPGLGLAARKYDAWPLFSSFAENGGDGIAAALALANMRPFPATAVALDRAGITWPWHTLGYAQLATRYTANPLWSMRWPAPGAGPSVPYAQKKITTGPVEVTVKQGALGHKAAMLELDAKVDLIMLQAGPSGFSTKVGDETVVVPEGQTLTLCRRDDGCVCPGEGFPASWRTFSDIQLILVFDPVRPGRTARGEARSWDPDVECGKRPPPQGSSNGDPHLVTYDGYGFDVMALGEFVTTRDPDGGFEVQTRHELYGEDGQLGALGSAVGTSAVAVGMGQQRVTFTAPSLEADAKEVVVRIDGEEVAAPADVGDVAIAVGSDGGHAEWTVTGDDGSEVRLLWFAGFFVTARPTAERAARAVGLLGAANGNAGDDLLLSDGTPLPLDASIDDVYAQAWLVTDADTLFDYEPGQSPDYFHLPSPPLSVQVQSLLEFFNGMTGTPPSNEAAEAYDRCDDELGPDATRYAVQSCAYDLMATSDDGYLGVWGESNEIRLEGEAFDWLWDMFSSKPEPQPGVAEPKAGEPSLVLDDGNPAGTLRLPEGAVVTFRTASCGPDAWIRVSTEAFAAEADDRTIEDGVALCADDPQNSLFGSHAIDGEAYGIASDGGAYVFRLPDGQPAGARVEITVDTEPTVVTDRPTGVRFDGRVRELGDAEVVVVENPGGGSWSQTGIGEDACVLIAPTFAPLGSGLGFVTLGAECLQTPTFSVVPTFDGELPVALVVVARTDAPTRFALLRG